MLLGAGAHAAGHAPGAVVVEVAGVDGGAESVVAGEGDERAVAVVEALLAAAAA